MKNTIKFYSYKLTIFVYLQIFIPLFGLTEKLKKDCPSKSTVKN